MKVSKAEEYCMYFPLLKPHSWGKRSAAQPKTIYSEVPLSPSKIAAHMAAVRLIRRTKYVRQIPFLLQYLQVEHDHCKQGKGQRQQISVHQQYAHILQVKAQKGRVAAVAVNAGGDQLGLCLLYTSPSPRD